MGNEMKIGMIGLDTSHVPAFTQFLTIPGTISRSRGKGDRRFPRRITGF